MYVREAGTNSPWISGTIELKQGNVHYEVRLKDGRLIKRHIDHIRPSTSGSIETLEQQLEKETLDPIDIPCPSELTAPLSPLDEPAAQQSPRNRELPGRSTRTRRAPIRYGNPLPV